jgi:hypothetical protein
LQSNSTRIEYGAFLHSSSTRGAGRSFFAGRLGQASFALVKVIFIARQCAPLDAEWRRHVPDDSRPPSRDRTACILAGRRGCPAGQHGYVNNAQRVTTECVLATRWRLASILSPTRCWQKQPAHRPPIHETRRWAASPRSSAVDPPGAPLLNSSRARHEVERGSVPLISSQSPHRDERWQDRSLPHC